MEAKNEIQKTETVSPLASAASLMAANNDLDVTKLKELLELQERYEANQAKKAYSAAMTAFKAKPPEIVKDKTVSYGQTTYNHASLGNVTSCINKALSKHGLSASWLTGQSEGGIQVTCRISHILGHSESTSLSAPPDDSGKKNKIQQISSTITYLERYTLLALTGLATYEDDDGKKGADNPSPKPVKPTADELKTITAIAEKLCQSAPEGKTVTVKWLAIVLYSLQGEYPGKTTNVAKVASRLMESGHMDSIWEDTGKQESTNNVKAQFKYKCSNCGHEFTKPAGTAGYQMCPECLSPDFTREVE